MSENPTEIPEIQRDEPQGLPIAAIAVIAILVIAGLGLVGFALFAGQQDNENRAISGTVSAVLAFTSTPTNTRPPTNTALPTSTAKPSDTAAPTNTAAPATAVPASETARPTNTRTRTPVPFVPSATNTSAPTETPKPSGVRGITGFLTLCAGKTQYATRIERICFRETIKNNTDATIKYNYLGVRYTNTSTGEVKLHPSWTGDLSIGPGCTGPQNTCGGPWEDGLPNIENPGTYNLEMVIRFDTTFEVIGPAMTITTINWTPSPSP